MADRREQLSLVLQGLKDELKRTGMWRDSRPPAVAFESTLPFCTDTLHFEEWLQFVLIERLEEMLLVHAPLPVMSGITPMAEFVWAQQEVDAIIYDLLRDIDELLS
ncbi:MAG: YqcC family protein [Gammaproteobacteria bacterium]|jgi:uncharacterized protein YqcC (DUF446 family)|nr:YqcC family protein [Gammaproteobacteria bacterium]